MIRNSLLVALSIATFAGTPVLAQQADSILSTRSPGPGYVMAECGIPTSFGSTCRWNRQVAASPNRGVAMQACRSTVTGQVCSSQRVEAYTGQAPGWSNPSAQPQPSLGRTLLVGALAVAGAVAINQSYGNGYYGDRPGWGGVPGGPRHGGAYCEQSGRC